ncbi:hypothetical protein [Marinilactibacillus kalidii]|uniref:hypothetical protein n=1 Tax=Marinilactibacillus kalidii TaxID=2820274 RepID=UPI001ABED67E|nr:hypothetical protein [Marinilactibacillus kalidii]
MIYMLQEIMKFNSEAILNKIFSLLLVINAIVSFVQLTVPNTTNLFYDLYFKESLTPLNEVVGLGYFNRAYGTFGTPVVLGIFSMFCFAIFLGLLSEKYNDKKLYLKIIATVILGLSGLSKTIILSMPIILIFYYFLTVFGIIKVKNRKILLIPILIIPVFLLMVNYLERAGTSIAFYLNYLTNPFGALTTRYDSTNGILVDSFKIIEDNILIGVGSAVVPNVFNGDSMYTGLLFNTGIIGFIIYFLTLGYSSLINLSRNNTTTLLCFLAIVLGGLAAPIQVDLLTAPLVAYIFQKSEYRIYSKKKRSINGV